MRSIRRWAVLISAAAVVTVGLTPSAVAASDSSSGLQLPQVAAAQRAATWLAVQLTPQGFVPTTAGGAQPSLSSTVQTALALSAANADTSGARSALSYVESRLSAYVTQDGSDGPGQLALLILTAEALGVSPASFGGSDLVTSLLSTEQTSGSNNGLFGTDVQADDYSAGTYQQGLALAALAAAGVIDTTTTRSAEAWLAGQQCPDGGWTTPDTAMNPCTGSPASFAGPDTNSTSVALEGLVSQRVLTSAESASGVSFLRSGEDLDGGWSYYPNTYAVPGSTDPDSLVIQALVALGLTPVAAPFVRGSATPISALLSFQLTSGSGSGAFYFPPAPSPANLIATYQAIPALEALPIPWGPSGRGYWEAASDGGLFSFGDAGFFGSMGGKVLTKPVVGIASTPDGKGYWEVASDGGLFSFGDAGFFGSMGGKVLTKPVVGIASTPDGKGYWEVASDGGLFSFGDAGFFGSMGGKSLAAPIVGVAATPDGKGYWEVASDGGLFSFGDAGFFGSMGGKALAEPVVGIAAMPDGKGYWEVASDGGLFAFGDAAFYGSMGGKILAKPVVGIATTPDGRGYWEVASDGGLFTFGDAGFYGSMGDKTLAQPVVGIGTDLGRPA